MRQRLLLMSSVWIVGAVLLRGVVVPGERCPEITSGQAIGAATASAGWMTRVQREDGSYLYEFDVNTGAPSPEYNAVRHAGVTLALYELAESGQFDALAPADNGLKWEIDHLHHIQGGAAGLDDPYTGEISLGGTALALAGLAHRRIATDQTTYDPLMHQLASFILLMQRSDGSFLSEWDRTNEAPYPNETSTYSTGEAFWALTLMHRTFPNEGWEKPSHMVADYVSFQRDLKEHQKYPPWADQWSAYAFAEMGAWPDTAPAGRTVLTDTNVAYARTLAERFGLLMRVESQRRDTWFSKITHGPEARSAGMATWVEGLDSFWRLAGKDSRLADLRPKIAERALCGAGMLVDRQVVGGDRVKTHPVESLGAWFTDGKTRMDDQQHALSGLLAAATILRERGK